MGALDVVQKYFDAWNSRNPEAIAATLSDNGTYEDPTTGGPLTGPAFSQYAGGLISAFPDLNFEVVSASATNDTTVAAQWLMKGTNSGPFGGGPPTGKTIALPGADFFTLEGEKIRSVKGYFDQRTLVDQLGLQVIVQPYAIGPFSFGYAVRATTGKKTKPGAMSLTWIEVRSEEEVPELRDRSRQIVQEMMEMPGFISTANMAVGHRFMTTTAWENPEAPRQMLSGGAHKEGMSRLFGPDFGAAFSTTVWVPERFNGMWVRCTACGQMADYDRDQGRCRCGQRLPEHPPYW